MTLPRVSILIPNFNNGRSSSSEGRMDLIGQLLESLRRTLADDPTPLEILAWDDGSTDDSLATLRDWAGRTWRGGQPFLTLTEAAHHGVLARHSNELVRQARGEILVRLDGDIVCLTPRWVSRLCETFDAGPPRLGVVGPKQLRPDGRIHALGDFVLHPKGYIHVGQGLGRFDLRHPIEVDHVMGAFYCFRRAVFEEIGGFDESFLRGQTIDFGLRARLAGWSCIAVPHIEFVHYHGARPPRRTEADSGRGIEAALATFERKWGFSRTAPDLDAVARRYRGTPLLWNARYFASSATPDAADPPPPSTLAPDQSDWARLAHDPAIRRRIELRGQVVVNLIRQTTRPGPLRLGVVGCGDGLLLHALAQHGIAAVGVDRCPAKVAFARQALAQQPIEGERPQVLHQPEPCRLPVGDGAWDMLLVTDTLERCHNPAGLLRDARRVLTRQGYAAFIAARGTSATNVPDAARHEHPYLWNELASQLRFCGWQVLNDARSDDASREVVVFARNVLGAAAGATEPFELAQAA